MYGTGTLTVHRGDLPGLDQNPSMKEVERFRTKDAAGKPASAFSTFGGDIELKNQRMYSKRVAVDFCPHRCGRGRKHVADRRSGEVSKARQPSKKSRAFLLPPLRDYSSMEKKRMDACSFQSS